MGGKGKHKHQAPGRSSASWGGPWSTCPHIFTPHSTNTCYSTLKPVGSLCCSLSLSLLPHAHTHTQNNTLYDRSSSRPFCQPLAGLLTITSVGFHYPASLCNLCTTWESVTEHSKDKIVPIPLIAIWHSNTGNCSLLKAVCSFLPWGWNGIFKPCPSRFSWSSYRHFSLTLMNLEWHQARVMVAQRVKPPHAKK